MSTDGQRRTIEQQQATVTIETEQRLYSNNRDGAAPVMEKEQQSICAQRESRDGGLLLTNRVTDTEREREICEQFRWAVVEGAVSATKKRQM